MQTTAGCLLAARLTSHGDQSMSRSRTKKRVILYSFSVVALAVLSYLGWAYVPHLGFDEDRTVLFGLLGESRYAEAEAVLDEMTDRYPKDVRVSLLRGYLAEHQGDLEKAKGIYRDSQSACHNDAQRQDLLVTVADIERRQGHLDRAERQLADATKRYGESFRSRHLRVLLFVDKHDYDAALGEVDLMAEEKPVNPHVLSLRIQIQRLQEASASGN